MVEKREPVLLVQIQKKNFRPYLELAVYPPVMIIMKRVEYDNEGVSGDE
jgi:hypothetical protein